MATLFKPGKPAQEVAVSSLKDLQQMIGGYVAFVSGDDGSIAFDEDGELKRLKPNDDASHWVQKRGVAYYFRDSVVLGVAVALSKEECVTVLRG